MENNKFELYRKEVEALHEAALDDVESLIISIIDRDYGFHVVAQFLDAEYPARIGEDSTERAAKHDVQRLREEEAKRSVARAAPFIMLT